MGLNPRYNGRVGVYRTNEIERFGLSVGDSYGGGIIAYIYVSGDPGYVSGQVHGIIADTVDLSYGLIWGCNTISVSTSSALGSGISNVNAIIAACSTTGTAPRVCDSLTKNGYSDWTLPSYDDLVKIKLSRDLIGGFYTGSFAWYWSSSQQTYATAQCLDFADGGGFQPVNKESAGPYSGLYTRAIRYF